MTSIHHLRSRLFSSSLAKACLSVAGATLLFSSLDLAHAKRGVREVDFEKYEQYMGPYFKDETREEFQKRMQWFDEADLGMFIHFGLYSELGGIWKGRETGMNYCEWIWNKLDTSMGDYHYQEYLDLVKVWNPENFDAEKYVLLAKELGMDYITIGAKHHEGFCLYPCSFSEFDIDSTPMKGRDILGELAAACKKHDLKFGIYYSIIDWGYTARELIASGDIKPNYQGIGARTAIDREAYFEYMKNQLKELVENYDPALIWFDGDWDRTFLTPERGFETYEFLRELKPSILINERCFSRKYHDMPKKDFGNLEKKKPSDELIERQQNPETREYYEYCTSVQGSWGHDARVLSKMNTSAASPESLLLGFAKIRQMHGNYLLNFGPDENGEIPEYVLNAARDFGKAAEKLTEGGDYSQQAMEAVLAELNFDESRYRNPEHLSLTNPEAYARAEQLMGMMMQVRKMSRSATADSITQEQRQQLQGYEKELQEVAKLIKENQDPLPVQKRLEEAEFTLNTLLNPAANEKPKQAE